MRFFLSSDWEFFLGNWEKKEDILDWEWGLISDPGDMEKRPWDVHKDNVLFQNKLKVQGHNSDNFEFLQKS